MDAPDPDGELMQRLQNGEDTALNELMNRWQQPLVGFICRYVGNETDALDLAQETFVRVFQSRHRYKHSAKFSTWLFTIASNLSRNLSRWRSRHPTISLDGNAKEEDSPTLGETLDSPDDTPSGTASRRELATAIRESIQSLPHDLRTAVLLFEYEDLSHQEIAAVLSCSAKAVETRLYRARAILREKLVSWKKS
jgi:RNA polymerase sigma-70 factor (ECF subfamily)